MGYDNVKKLAIRSLNMMNPLLRWRVISAVAEANRKLKFITVEIVHSKNRKKYKILDVQNFGILFGLDKELIWTLRSNVIPTIVKCDYMRSIRENDPNFDGSSFEDTFIASREFTKLQADFTNLNLKSLKCHNVEKRRDGFDPVDLDGLKYITELRAPPRWPHFEKCSSLRKLEVYDVQRNEDLSPFLNIPTLRVVTMWSMEFPLKKILECTVDCIDQLNVLNACGDIIFSVNGDTLTASFDNDLVAVLLSKFVNVNKVCIKKTN